MSRKAVIVVFLFLPLHFLFPQSIPIVQKGILDVSEWDFELSKPIKLQGDWVFIWNNFIDPEEDLTSDSESYITIPSYWNRADAPHYPPHGFASYQLKILLPPDCQTISLDINYILTAYQLFADGDLMASSGIPGKNKSSSVPYSKPQIVLIFPKDEELILTLHVSNFHLNDGGMWEDIRMGSYQQIKKQRELRLAFGLFISTSILIMGIYHFGIYIYRKKEKAALYFALFCLSIAARGLATGEIYLSQLIPSISWSFLLKYEYLSFYIAVPSFFMYIKNLFPKDYHRIVEIAVLGFSLIFSIIVIVTPPSIFNLTLFPFQMITAAIGFYAIYILIKAVIKRRNSSLILLVGFIVMFIAFVNDVLHSQEIIHTGLLMPVGTIFFIFSQALLILNRTSWAYKTVEKQKDELLESHDLLERSRLGTILGLAKLAEYRDEDTGKHLERMREYSRMIASCLSKKENYLGYITEQYQNDIYQSAILHDIGKVAVPDSILLKNGSLDDDEFILIQRHTKIGGDALLNIESQIHMKSFLTLGKEIAWYHHEKWDGSGYPKGLKGKEIPLSARITAVADVYDALTSERPYKKAFSHAKARNIIIEGRGSHFDPEIVDVFLEIEEEINQFREDNT